MYVYVDGMIIDINLAFLCIISMTFLEILTPEVEVITWKTITTMSFPI